VGRTGTVVVRPRAAGGWHGRGIYIAVTRMTASAHTWVGDICLRKVRRTRVASHDLLVLSEPDLSYCRW
jgi:hypothetical protein